MLLARKKGSKIARQADVRHGGDKGKGEASSKEKKPIATCWGCEKRGHYQHDCRSSKGFEARGKESRMVQGDRM